MKKRTHKGKATSRRKIARKRKSNPTAAVATRRTGKASAYFHKAKARVKSTAAKFDIVSLAKDAAFIAGGAILATAADRQAEKFLPNMNPMVRTGLVTVAVGVAAYFLGAKLKQKELAKGMLNGAVTAAALSIGRTFAPSVFAGAEGGLAGWDPATGQWDDTLEGLYEEGATYELVQPVGV